MTNNVGLTISVGDSTPRFTMSKTIRIRDTKHHVQCSLDCLVQGQIKLDIKHHNQGGLANLIETPSRCNDENFLTASDQLEARNTAPKLP